MTQVRNPLTKEDLMAVLRRVTPDEYWRAIEEDPAGSIALVRAVARIFEVVAERGLRAAQSSFFLPYQTQADEPAGSERFAEMTVVMKRTEDVWRHVIMDPGTVIIEGLQRRRYLNTSRVEWPPFDVSTKTMTLRCEAPGEVGNMDFVADPAGKITKQDESTPDTDMVFIANQSNDRTAINASIEAATASERANVIDSGLPDQFTQNDVGLYLRVAVGNANNIGRVMRIIDFREAETETTDGRLRRRVVVDDGPVRTRLMLAAVEDNSAATFTDITAAANDGSSATLLPDPLGTDDAVYFGGNAGNGPFSRLRFDISTAGEGSWAIAWEYWNGAWTSIPDLSDEVEGFTQLGVRSVEWPVPGDWVTNTVDGVSAYHVRARVTSGAPTLTVAPVTAGVQAFFPQPLTAEDDVVTWQVLDWRDLGFALADITAPTGGRDDVLSLLGDERNFFQQTDESDEAFRQRISRLPDTVSPEAVSRAINRILEPFGFRGKAVDLEWNTDMELFEGFFADIDACDYYEPGDAHPTSEYKLPLSEQEAYGWGFIYLPFLGLGESGMASDEGPTLVLEDETFVNSAADAGFTDGAPVPSHAAYRAIYETLNKITQFGVGFTMIRDADLNADPCP